MKKCILLDSLYNAHRMLHTINARLRKLKNGHTVKHTDSIIST
jgi:hypothetical protein